MKPRLFQVLAVYALGSISSSAFANEGPEAHTPHHTVGMFVGDTVQERREGGTLGLEYEYRFNPHYGAGLTVEHVFGNFDTSVLVVPLALHRDAWKVYLGPGIEDSEEGTEGLLRLGVEYGFHLGELEVSPQVDLDFVDGEEIFVFGVVFALPL